MVLTEKTEIKICHKTAWIVHMSSNLQVFFREINWYKEKTFLPSKRGNLMGQSSIKSATNQKIRACSGIMKCLGVKIEMKAQKIPKERSIQSLRRKALKAKRKKRMRWSTLNSSHTLQWQLQSYFLLRTCDCFETEWTWQWSAFMLFINHELMGWKNRSK